MPLARAAHKKALEIDPMLQEALAGLASVTILYDFNWKEAGRLFELAMSRGPLPGGARARYGHYLLFTGQPDAALREHEVAVQEDPLNLMLRSILASVLLMVERPADAATECRRILELNENFQPAHFYLSLSYLERGDIQSALASAEKAYALAPWARANSGYVAGLLKLSGDAGRAEAVLDKLGDGRDYGAPFGFVYYYLVCSDVEQAADWAEKAIEQRDPTVRFLPLLPLTKDLRRSSRWPTLARMMNLH
jgi:Tfp pilus assembly protein PilF